MRISSSVAWSPRSGWSAPGSRPPTTAVSAGWSPTRSVMPSPRVARSDRGCWSAAGRSPRPRATATSSAARPTASTAFARRSDVCSRTRAPTGSRSCPPVAASPPARTPASGRTPWRSSRRPRMRPIDSGSGSRATPTACPASTTRRRPGSTRSSTARCSARTGSGRSTRQWRAAWSSVGRGRSRRSRPARATRSRPARTSTSCSPTRAR